MSSIIKKIKEKLSPPKKLTEAEKAADASNYVLNESTGRYNLIKKGKKVVKEEEEEEKLTLSEVLRTPPPTKKDNTPPIKLSDVVIDKSYTVAQEEGFAELNERLKQLDLAKVNENVEKLSEIIKAQKEGTPIFVDKTKLKESFPSQVQNKPLEELTPIKNDEELEEDIKKNTFNTETGTVASTSGYSGSSEMSDGNERRNIFRNSDGETNSSVEELQEKNQRIRKGERAVLFENYDSSVSGVETVDETVDETVVPEDIIPTTPSGLPFAVDTPKQEHPVKYHKNSILFYFGSIEKPEFDLELEKNVFEAKMTKDEIIMNSEAVIKNYGTVLFVYKRMSDTRDEFHELIQMQFCYIRNLARGSRTRSALVPISELIGFSNALAGNNVVQEKVNDQVDTEGLTEEQVESLVVNQATPSPNPPQPIVAEQQVQISSNDAFSRVIEAYRNNKMDSRGKPIFNQSLIDSTNIINFNYVGSQSQTDPLETYESRYKVKIVKF